MMIPKNGLFVYYVCLCLCIRNIVAYDNADQSASIVDDSSKSDRTQNEQSHLPSSDERLDKLLNPNELLLSETDQSSRMTQDERSTTMRAKPYVFDEKLEKKENDGKEKRYVMKYKKQKMGGSAVKVAANANADLLETSKVHSIERSNADVVVLKSESELMQLRNDANVEYVEEDYKYYINDPGLSTSLLSPLMNEAEIPYGIDMVKALEVNATHISNRKVCIIDSGYDMGHSDLQKRGVDGYTGDEDLPWDEDTLGHGTHVAGTIAALGNNDWGVTGAIPSGELNIYIVRVFGSGDYWAWGSDLAVAMYECADNDANIINMSLGGSSYSSFIQEAARDINENMDVLLVASAGNSGYSGYNYPASYDNVMSVAAIDNTTTRASFSNYNNKVDIAAPGVDVMSTVPRPFGSYDIKSGTSMAAPHVTGVAALVWSHYPSITAKQLQQVLESSATDLGISGKDNYYGYGLINAKAAYDFLADGRTFSPTASPTGLECVEGKKKFDLKIVPDNYASTTTWELREACSGDLKLDGGEESKVACLADKNYVFTIYDSYGEGLCCAYGAGKYELYFDGELIQSGGEFGSEESFAFGDSPDSCSPSQSPTAQGPTPAPTGLECEDGQKKFDLKLVPDDDYYQATWTLTKTCTGETVLEGVDQGNITCLDDLEYDFTISEYNGLCCSYGMGYYDLYFDEMFVQSGGSFYGEESVTFSTKTAASCEPTMSPTPLQCEDGKKNFDLKITLDRESYDYQTSWKLRNACSGDTVLEGDSDGITTCVDDLPYNFTIYDYNGLCCWYGDGSYQVYYDGAFVKSGAEFVSSETVKFGSATANTCAPTMAPTGLQCPEGEQKFVLQITPDRYPYKNDWWLRDYESRSTIESGDGYDKDVTLCLSDSSMYEFEMTSDWGDGICCSYGNGEYNIYYNDNLLRTGKEFGSQEITIFGSLDESLTLGFVGASAILDNATQVAFEFQTEKYLKNVAMSRFDLTMNSFQLKVVTSILSTGVSDGVQKYRRLLDNKIGDRGLEQNDSSGVLVYLQITADMYLFNGNDDDYGSRDGISFSALFEEGWNDFEDAVMPIMLSNTGGNNDDNNQGDNQGNNQGNNQGDTGGSKNLDNGSNSIVTIIMIIVTCVLGVVLLGLIVMQIQTRRDIAKLSKVSPTIPDKGRDRNDGLQENTKSRVAFEERGEEKVEEGDEDNEC